MNDAAAKSASAPVLRARLLTLVGQILDKSDGQSLPVDARLSELGMSSMKMVNLMLASRRSSTSSIPQSDITPENFASIGLDRGAARSGPLGS